MIKKLCNWILGIHPNSISFWETFQLTRLPIVCFKQKDRVLNFVFDSGSDQNIIDKSALDKIECEYLNKEGNVFGINGTLDKTKVCTIHLSYKDIDYPTNFLVCDMSGAVERLKSLYGTTIHGLIGTEFFNQYKYVLDFDKLIAYSKA